MLALPRHRPGHCAQDCAAGLNWEQDPSLILSFRRRQPSALPIDLATMLMPRPCAVQGFNRSFCGKNATMYGKGVYFARDASYSSNYTSPDAQGVHFMFLCRVVVGEYCQGVRDALAPKVRMGNQLFDSTVDTMQHPRMYVTYHDAQAYPEYIVKFRQ